MLKWPDLKLPPINLWSIWKIDIERKEDFHFYQNTACRYFPCHEGVPLEEFNCLFCYCPLMFIECEGTYTTMESGHKDCSACTLNHDKNSWRYIIGKLNSYMKIKTKFTEVTKKWKNQH